ncbi:MAG: beta-lactamase family protein [Candidatus Bathyarchaeota archaeon]|nr:beta-lactamase family protein [Candidatus Bathyarchaeota archaeon]
MKNDVSSNNGHNKYKEFKLRLEDAPRKLDEALVRLLSCYTWEGKPAIKNAVIQVDIPAYGFIHTVACGEAYANSKAPMTPSHQFHIASVTKTMTATLILQLCERGALGSQGLDTTLGDLELFDEEVLDRIHVLNEVSYGNSITVRHLLTHTAGIKDASIDDATGTAADYGGQPAPGSYGARFGRSLMHHMTCINDPEFDLSSLHTTKEWIPWDPTRPFEQEAGVVNWFLNSGTAETPLSRPGEAYHYSDTGYVMLGLLTEKLAKKSFHTQLRERIFDPLGMNMSYLAYAKDPDSALWQREVADFYVGNVPLVTTGFNISFDWAGGGVVSTAKDLNVFLQALIRGDLFKKRETLAKMVQWKVYPGLKEPIIGIGLGIRKESTPFGTILWGHGGIWGAKMCYAPATGIFLSGTVNQRLVAPNRWWIDILQVMHNLK